MTSRFLFACIVPALLMASCRKHEVAPIAAQQQTGSGTGAGTGSTGSTGQRPKVTYDLRAINRSTGIALKTTASSITWDSGTALPTLIKFEAKRNGTEVEFKTTNTAPVNLMAPVAASLGNITLDTGRYEEIELRMELEPGGGIPAIRLSGTFTDSLVTLPVRFEADERIEIRTEQHGVHFTAASLTATTTLDLSGFTAGITRSTILAAQLTNGVLVISKNDNKALYAIILRNLEDKHHGSSFHP